MFGNLALQCIRFAGKQGSLQSYFRVELPVVAGAFKGQMALQDSWRCRAFMDGFGTCLGP